MTVFSGMDHVSIFAIFAVYISSLITENDEVCAQEVNCGFELTEERGLITSPNFPETPDSENVYPNNQFCHWFMDRDEKTLIQMRFANLHIEPGPDNSNTTCIYDYVNVTTSIETKTFCGTYAPEGELRSMKRLDIYFKSDRDVGWRGFRLFYQRRDDWDPCKENEECENGECVLDDFYDPVCSCEDGYEGVFCERDTDECASNPCLNGGSCHDQVDSYQCTCSLKFDGVHCENETPDPCVPNPCQNDGSCSIETNETSGLQSLSCQCRVGYSGSNCETLTGCGNPGIPGVKHRRRFDFNSKLTLSCPSGYALKGSSATFCMSNGEWSHQLPQCKLNERKQAAQQKRKTEWMLTMVAIGSVFAVTLVAFISWIATKRPWSTSNDVSFDTRSIAKHRRQSEIPESKTRNARITTVTWGIEAI